jgi:hypothetical protein
MDENFAIGKASDPDADTIVSNWDKLVPPSMLIDTAAVAAVELGLEAYAPRQPGRAARDRLKAFVVVSLAYARISLRAIVAEVYLRGRMIEKGRARCTYDFSTSNAKCGGP